MALREKMSAVCIGASFLVREEIAALPTCGQNGKIYARALMLQRASRDE